MDPITQGLLGAAVSQALFTRQLGRRAWWLGALGGMAPDLDIFIRSAGDPLLLLLYHRQFTHSLLFIPIGGLIIGGLLLLIGKSLRRQWRWVLLACTAGFASHGILDAMTSYGTVLLWPFSHQRFAWDVISIIDPLYTGILVIGVVLSAYWCRRQPAVFALILSTAYLGLGFYQHQRVMSLQTQLAARHGHVPVQMRAIPQLASLTRWRTLYRSDNQFYVGTARVPLSGKGRITSAMRLTAFAENDLPAYIKESSQLYRDFNVFQWFTNDSLSVAQWRPLILIDARYLMLQPPQALWGIEFPLQADDDEHVSWVTGVTLER
jgi:inner membrane protein